jgi:acetoin utilization deacetylase AcuC-like enzyme
MQHIIDWYRPGAIVLQMGADSLAGDKLGGFNLTLDGKLVASFRKLKLTNQGTPNVRDSSRALGSLL